MSRPGQLKLMFPFGHRRTFALIDESGRIVPGQAKVTVVSDSTSAMPRVIVEFYLDDDCGVIDGLREEKNK